MVLIKISHLAIVSTETL